ncbi:MAG: ABC1 kinase family protein [Armatimonadota bacterium]
MASPFISKRELSRAWQIVRVIGRYGLVPFAQPVGFGRLLGIFFWRRPERQYEEISLPARLRLALTELGTTFIKLGQVLSARSDLLPQEFLTELAKLQDDVYVLPFEQMEPVFIAAFGIPPQQAFQTFDTVPAASASIGQVYPATLANGVRVMVKIQRPGVHELVATDLSLMARVARLADSNHTLRHFDFPALVREFRSILQDELIYTLEAHNAETLSKEMIDNPHIRLQQVYWPLTTRTVLTTVRVDGMKITNLPALDAAGIDRRELAVRLANSMLEQIFIHGMFHGDPHPGNLLVQPDGILVFLDTGMVGRLDRVTRELLIELSVSIFDQDIDAVLGNLQQLGVVTEIGNLPALRRDLSALITKYYFLPRRELRLGELLQRMNSLLFAHGVRMAYEFGLLAKALFVAEGIAIHLNPDFDYNEAARPVIDELRHRYYSAQTIIEDSKRELRGLQRQIIDLPRRLSSVLNHLENGTLTVRLHDDFWEAKQHSDSALMNRLSLSLLITGLLVATAVIFAAHPSGILYHLAWFGLIAAIIFTGILLYMFLRSGRV